MDLKSLRRYKVSGSYKKKVKNRYTQALSSIQQRAHVQNVNTGQGVSENMTHGSAQNICFVPQQGCSNNVPISQDSNMHEKCNLSTRKNLNMIRYSYMSYLSQNDLVSVDE